MKRKGKEGEFRSNLHRGGTFEYYRMSEPELELPLNLPASQLPVCGVDILQSNRGPLIMEINSTPGLEGIEGASQKNNCKSYNNFY